MKTFTNINKTSSNTLGKIATAISIAAFLSSSSAIAAGKKMSEQSKAELKGATVFTTAAVVGAVAAGPVGMFIGALSGAYLGEEGIKAAKDKEELASTHNTLSEMREAAKIREQKLAQLEKSAANRLEFMVLFPTGIDELSRQDVQRLSSLANYMKDNPDLRVRLDGHADPRGTDEYNNVLSEERALSVMKALAERGIKQDRIDYFAHGSDLSSAYDGDLEAYALERKVRIEVYSVSDIQNVAANQ